MSGIPTKDSRAGKRAFLKLSNTKWDRPGKTGGRSESRRRRERTVEPRTGLVEFLIALIWACLGNLDPRSELNAPVAVWPIQ